MKRSIFVSVAVVVGLSRLASAAGPKSGGSAADSAKQQVMQAEKAWFDARANGDKATFANMLADEFTWGTTNGRFATKEEQLARFKAGPNPETGKLEIRMYGADAAVVITAATTSSGPRKIVRVWVRRNGKWEILMHQSYLVPPYSTTGGGQ